MVEGLLDNTKYYSEKEIVKETMPKKIYLSDTGLAYLFTLDSEIGRKMENVVYMHMIRYKRPYTNIYYYKTPQGYEVDFLIKEGNKIKELIQVVYDISNPGVLKREIRALLHAKKNLNLGDNVSLTIITWDYEDVREEKWHGMQGKIRFVPLWKWLLSMQ